MWRERFRSVSAVVMRIGTPVVAVALIGLVYFLGVRSERTGFVHKVLDPGLKRITQPVLNAFRGRPPAVTQLQLALNDPLVDSLAAIYARSRATGWIDPGGTRRVGRCAIDERATDAMIALRPGPIDPLEKKHWPFQVLLQEPDTILGIQSFDLIPVRDDAPLREWFLSRALQDQGLPSLALALVEVHMNDRELGLYAIEERVDSMAISRWGRGPGPVLRFDDELRTAVEETKLRSHFPVDPALQQDWLAAPIMASQGVLVSGVGSSSRRYERAVRRLDDFRAGRAPVSEVFDVKATARFLALCDLLGGQRATNWWNMCFLLDSLSGSLVPLPQHGNSFAPISSIVALRSGSSIRFPTTASGFRDRIFGDADLFHAYVAYLDTFSSAGWMEALLRRVSNEYAVPERIVRSEYPLTRPDAMVFAHNRDVIVSTLRPPDLVLAFTQDPTTPDQMLAITNVHALPVEVTAFIAGTDTIPLQVPLLLWPRERDKPLVYVRTRIPLPREFHGAVAVIVNVLGLKEAHQVPVRAWSSFTAN